MYDAMFFELLKLCKYYYLLCLHVCLYNMFTGDQTGSLARLNSCISDIRVWMIKNK